MKALKMKVMLLAAILALGGAGLADEKAMETAKKIDAGKPNPIKVAVYDNGDGRIKSAGRAGVFETLKSRPEIKATIIGDMRPETLKNYDVLVLTTLPKVSSVDQMDMDQGKSWTRALLNFVDSGKGLVLGHDCVGYRGDFGATKLFPGVCSANAKADWKQELTVTAKHPVTEGVSNKFKHEYYDHVIIKPGDRATVLAVDADSRPVVVAGTISRGRIAAIGYLMGVRSEMKEQRILKNSAAPLNDAEKALLLNAVKWCSEPPRYEVSQASTDATLLPEVAAYNKKLEAEELAKWKALPPARFDAKTITVHFYGGRNSFAMDTPEKIREAVANCRAMGFDTIKVYAKSTRCQYPSVVSPSDILTNDPKDCVGFNGKIGPDFDPTGILVKEARTRNMKVAMYLCPFKTTGDLWKSHPSLTEEEARAIKSGKPLDEAITSYHAKYWACPDHPETRALALKFTEELIKRYDPDELWLDYIRYKNDYACFCDYSVEKRAEFMKKHPDLSKEEATVKFAEESIVGFVEEWNAFCKKLKPSIKTAAYTHGTARHQEWMARFPLDYHSQRISRGLNDSWGSLDAVKKQLEAFLGRLKAYRSAAIPYPFVDTRDNKGPERVATEYRLVSAIMAENQVPRKLVDCWSYQLLVDKNGKINEPVAAALSETLGGNWKAKAK